jgi:hypothetical protein
MGDFTCDHDELRCPCQISSKGVEDQGHRRAAGIYGTIITAAVIAASGNILSTAALEVTVLVTLVVYWLAEQYAAVLAEHTHAGHLPNRRTISSSLVRTWPMVTASFVPLATLAVVRLVGASASAAAYAALTVTIVLLLIHGHTVGKAAGLRGIRLVVISGTAGLLGLAMVVLKVVLHHHS